MRGHAKGPFNPFSGDSLPALRVQKLLVLAAGATLSVNVEASETSPVFLKVVPYTNVAATTGANSLILGNASVANAYLASGDSLPEVVGTISAEKRFVLKASTTLIASYTSAAIAASGTLTITGVVANNDTIVINGQTYTFKTALTGGGATANEVLIGANATASGNNLVAATNAAAGGGTTYGSATIANAAMSAANGTAGVVNYTARTAGTAGNSVTAVESLTNATFTSGVTAGLFTGGEAVSPVGEMHIFLDA